MTTHWTVNTTKCLVGMIQTEGERVWPHFHLPPNHTWFWQSCFINSLSFLAVHHGFIAHCKSFDQMSTWDKECVWLIKCMCVEQKDKEGRSLMNSGQ